MGSRFWVIALCAAFAGLSACNTLPDPVEVPDDSAASGVIVATPDVDPAPAPTVKTPPPPAPAPPVDAPPPIPEIPVFQSPLRDLPYWSEADLRPALTAFRRTCQAWSGADGSDALNANLPEYGRFEDWTDACELSMLVGDGQADAKQYFENAFSPVPLFAQNNERGLLTGYYQPEIDVRRVPTPEFSEPILAVPTSERAKTLPRAKITPRTSRVIAYGRPLEVFFMQIQGSGHIRFADGRQLRAAYADNNGHAYKSIGKVLIERGEVSQDRAAKRDIEAWMRRKGPKAARALINENKRYIFFTEQKIEPGEGPLGAMRVPLTGMGSMAVDPRYHPYGSLYWINVKIPQEAGDYRGRESGQMLVAQDTGKAIRGAMRGDLYFGSGDAAGALAGVMKHDARWTALLPRGLAERLARERPVG